MTNSIDPKPEATSTAESPGSTSLPQCSGTGTDREKIRVLERHVDHLMGQLYHQVGIIHSQRDHVAHLEKQLKAIEDTPRLLDQSLQKIAQLKEDLAGRKEVELDLRRRVESLEREEQVKEGHIKRLEEYLHKFWYSPHRRLLRSVRNSIRGLLGRNTTESNGGTSKGDSH